MLAIEMLPARNGDCLWIEYGDPDDPCRVLVDGGTKGTHNEVRRKLGGLAVDKRKLELLVITHVDADHIAGILSLLDPMPSGLTIGDVWFNGWRHLPEEDLEAWGPVQGERLSTRLVEPDFRWNRAFDGAAVAAPDGGPLPSITLDGGLRLTLLSPEAEQLQLLKPVWECECRKAGLEPGVPIPPDPPDPPDPPPGLERLGDEPLPDVVALAEERSDPDGSEANGSSIALLAEYDSKRVLLAGDAHADVLASAIGRLGTARLDLDAFKLPHHGSKANVRKALLERVTCRRYLVSTNGAQFEHPDAEAISRVILHGGDAPQLVFNYKTKYNRVWGDPRLCGDYEYTAKYPPPGRVGIRVEL